MPNYFAHLVFGEQVLSALPSHIQALLNPERAAFDLGCLGPDILFFYHPFTPNQVRLEGSALHRQSALSVFQRMQSAIERNVPMSRGYAAGFLCHLALDSSCHPYINAWAAQGGITHLAIEAEFDRLLMNLADRPFRNHTNMPLVSEEAVFQAAALAYEQAGTKEVRKSFSAMRRDTKLLAHFYGTPLGRLANQLCRRFSSLSGCCGIFLDNNAVPASVESSQALLSLLTQTVSIAAEQTIRFWAAVEIGAPLDPWLDRDFNGSVYSEQKTQATAAIV